MEFDQKADAQEAVPLELTRKGLAQGFHQMIVPTDMGGTGLDALTSLIILEELAAGDAGYATTWHVNKVTLTTLLNLGGVEQSTPFVRQIIEGEGGL